MYILSCWWIIALSNFIIRRISATRSFPIQRYSSVPEIITMNTILIANGWVIRNCTQRVLWLTAIVHIAQEDENDRVAVVSSLQPSNMYALANFSFLLVLGLAIILMFLFVQGVANYFRGEKLYFSARIQLLLNFAFFCR